MKHAFATGIVFLLTAWALYPPSASADTQADEVIRKLKDTYRAQNTLRADITITGVVGPNKNTLQFQGKVLLKKPNLWRYDMKGHLDARWGGARQYTLVSDGKNSWVTNLLAGRFLKEPVIKKGSDGKEYVIFPADPLSRLFYEENWLTPKEGGGRRTRLLPAQKIDGIECGEVEIVTSGIDTSHEIHLYVSADYHVRRIRERQSYMGGWDEIEVNLKDLQMDKALPAGVFTFVPSRKAVESKKPVERSYWFLGRMLDE